MFGKPHLNKRVISNHIDPGKRKNKKKRNKKQKKLGCQTFPVWTGLNNVLNDKPSLYNQGSTL